VVIKRIISHTIHFMCYFDSLRYSCFSRKYQGHQIPWRADKATNTNTGEMSHLHNLNKREVGAGCFFPAVIVLAQSSCPGHGCLISSSSGGNISVQARAGAKGAGQFPGKTHFIVIHYPPSDNTYDILAAPQQSQTFHRVPLLLFSIQRSLPRLKVR